MYDSESGHMFDIITPFLERTDDILIEPYYIEDNSEDYLREMHPYMGRGRDIFHNIDGREFASGCRSCTELRYLCTGGMDRHIYSGLLELALDNKFRTSPLRPYFYDAAFMPFGFSVPSMAPVDVMGIVGMAIFYDAEDAACRHPRALTGKESFEHILAMTTSMVRRYAEGGMSRRDRSRILKIRIEGMWQDFDPEKAYLYRANRLEI
jgi:hypothetical protein